MWLWVADHVFDTGLTINVTSPRGMLIQSTGPVFMYGVSLAGDRDRIQTC